MFFKFDKRWLGLPNLELSLITLSLYFDRIFCSTIAILVSRRGTRPSPMLSLRRLISLWKGASKGDDRCLLLGRLVVRLVLIPFVGTTELLGILFKLGMWYRRCEFCLRSWFQFHFWFRIWSRVSAVPSRETKEERLSRLVISGTLPAIPFPFCCLSVPPLLLGIALLTTLKLDACAPFRFKDASRVLFDFSSPHLLSNHQRWRSESLVFVSSTAIASLIGFQSVFSKTSKFRSGTFSPAVLDLFPEYSRS